MEYLTIINDSNESTKNYVTKPIEDLTSLSIEDLRIEYRKIRERERSDAAKYHKKIVEERIKNEPNYVFKSKPRKQSPNNTVNTLTKEELLEKIDRYRNTRRKSNNKNYHEVVKQNDELYTNFLNKCKKTTNTYYHKNKALSVSNNSISCF
jgi:hypothetical protein